ncbi:MAG: bifunctional phosphopantothenoylcysteine decarboxylase/phosphopantothenate--cysteine ligase CoaBC [Saprospiraceae bacterium]
MKGKKILLGISGSIAAYKAAFLTRLLIKQGAEVQVLMTPAATSFITPLTLSTLSKRPVIHEISSEEGWNNHVDMGLWADAMIVAPTTATTISKMANGICDNVIVATYLSARCPVFFAPAMDLDMWVHPATLQNVSKLTSYGNHLIPVGHGELASGLVGAGRMAEPENIVAYVNDFFEKEETPIKEKNILITAGPTYEDIDPVRYLGNRSSGKMGICIAEEAAIRGANVTLILGPTHLKVQHPKIKVISVRSAENMYQAANQHFKKNDVTIMAAAVADYRPKEIATQKVKKVEGNLKIELERTKDIAAELGRQKRKNQVNVGFALETNNELENAQKKLSKKNFDFIVLNSLQDKGAGFQHDTNKVTFVDSDNNRTEFELKSKKAVAADILDKVESYFI